MTPTAQRWTPEMVAVIHANSWGRKTPAEIAVMLGVSETAVVTKFRKLKVGYTSRLYPVQRERLRHYADKGWSPTSISRQVGLPVALVEMHLTPA